MFATTYLSILIILEHVHDVVGHLVVVVGVGRVKVHHAGRGTPPLRVDFSGNGLTKKVFFKKKLRSRRK